MKPSIKIITLIILIFFSTGLSEAALTNAENLTGTWNIVQSNGSIIDSIDISLVVSSKTLSRFDFSQASQNGSNLDVYQGLLLDDILVFNLIELGYSKTYIAKIDFALNGGAGVQISTRLASCTTVGDDDDLVSKKNIQRLSDNSARCDGTKLEDSMISNIKIVKSGVSANTIPDASSADPDLVANQTKIETRLNGVWAISDAGSSKKLLIKDPVADFLGYKFIYKVVENSTQLINLSENDFLTGDRYGYYIDNYLILNTSRFDIKDELFIFKTPKTSGTGTKLFIDNSDCFPLKKPISGTMICTPNEDSNFISNIMKRKTASKINKSNTNIIINF